MTTNAESVQQWKKYREDLNGATGASDMAGKAAKVAVERCGKQPRYNEEQRGRSLRSRREKAFQRFDELRRPANLAARVTFNVIYPAAPARIRVHRALISAATRGDVKPAHDARSEWSQREWSRWEESDIDGQTREGEASGMKPNQAVRHGQAKRG